MNNFNFDFIANSFVLGSKRKKRLYIAESPIRKSLIEKRTPKSLRRKSESFLQRKFSSPIESSLRENSVTPSVLRYSSIDDYSFHTGPKKLLFNTQRSPTKSFKSTTVSSPTTPSKYKMQNSFSKSISGDRNDINSKSIIVSKTPKKSNLFKYNSSVQYKIQVKKHSDSLLFDEQLVKLRKRQHGNSFLTPPSKIKNSPSIKRSIKTVSSIQKYTRKTESNEKQSTEKKQLSSLFDFTDLKKNFEKVKMTMKRNRNLTAKHVPVQKLTEEEKNLLNRIFRGPQNDVVAIIANIELTRSDIQKLRNFEWLNDECINSYMAVLAERSKKNSHLPDCHFFNSFFYMYLSTNGYNYEKVKNWTKNVDIFTKNKVIIPVNLSNTHWTLAVINFDTKCFEYYDSLGNSNFECLERLRRYIKDQYRTKHGGEYDLSEWRDMYPKDIPHQTNGSDCGVFVCKYADYCSQDKSFDFRQSDMSIIRKRIILEIINSCEKM